MRTPEQIIGKDRLLQLIFEGYAVVKAGAKCPFSDGAAPNDLRPEDPCPICGDLGTLEAQDRPSRCIG